MNENQKKIIELAQKKDISKMGFREIGRELGINNPQTVIYHLAQLKKKGLLYLDNKKQKVAQSKAFLTDNLFNIPIVGSANCGMALELAQENILGFLKISPKVLERKKPANLYVIKAAGDSMNQARDIKGGPIENGDYVIVDYGNTNPVNGDYVLSVIDGAANIKRFYKNRKEIRLVSESSFDIPPIILHEEDLETSGYLVNGVVIRVIKN